MNESTSDTRHASCPQPMLCPLSRVNAGVPVRIKQLSTSPEMSVRLREMGFCEEQCIRLISRQSHLVCQVCQARVGLHPQLAEHIWVEPLAPAGSEFAQKVA